MLRRYEGLDLEFSKLQTKMLATIALLASARVVWSQTYGEDLSPVLTLCDVNQGDQMTAEVSDGTDHLGFHYDAQCTSSSEADQGYSVSLPGVPH